MSLWTTPLRTGLRLCFDGAQFTVAEIEGRRILLRQFTDGGVARLRQVDVSVLLAHPTTRILVESPDDELSEAGLLSGLDDGEDEELTTRFRHVQEVLTGFQLGSEVLALPGEPRAEYGPGTPKMSRYAAKARELGVGESTIRGWVAKVRRSGPAGLVDARPVVNVLDRAGWRRPGRCWRSTPRPVDRCGTWYCWRSRSILPRAMARAWSRCRRARWDTSFLPS